jgi:hypothetical protein
MESDHSQACYTPIEVLRNGSEVLKSVLERGGLQLKQIRNEIAPSRLELIQFLSLDPALGSTVRIISVLLVFSSICACNQRCSLMRDHWPSLI